MRRQRSGRARRKRRQTDRTRMPARRRSRGHDRRHNTSSLVHSSGGTYTRSVSLSPSLPPFPLSVSVSLSILPARTCVSSRCKRRATRSRAHARAARRTCACSLASLFFRLLSSRRVEGNHTSFSSSYSRSRLSAARESTHRDTGRSTR